MITSGDIPNLTPRVLYVAPALTLPVNSTKCGFSLLVEDSFLSYHSLKNLKPI